MIVLCSVKNKNKIKNRKKLFVQKEIIIHFNMYVYIHTYRYIYTHKHNGIYIHTMVHVYIYIYTQCIYTYIYTHESESASCSVMSDSLRPHGLYSPWNSPGQNMEWVAFPFSRGSFWPRNQMRVSCIAGRFFSNWAIRGAHIHTYNRILLNHEKEWYNAICGIMDGSRDNHTE